VDALDTGFSPAIEPMTATPRPDTRPVREGEELDVAKLRAFFDERVPEIALGDIHVEQFPGGFSNLTYLLRIGDTEVVLRRPPRGAHGKGGHDKAREYGVHAALHGPYGKVPRPIAVCHDDRVLGPTFYLMERVHGLVIRGAPPASVAGDTTRMRAMSESLVDTLADLHAFDWRAAGLDRIAKPEGYVARQVGGWTQRYAAARTDDVPALERVAAWLAEHAPRDTPSVLIHNDYKYDNVMLDADEPTRIRAVLDWEMATIGDPLMDVGTSLAYWMDADDPEEMRSVLPSITGLPGSLSRAEVLARYVARTRRAMPTPEFYYAFGLFKTAVILQQIYARYRQGLTTDPRFAALGTAVRACALGASLAIEKGRIDRLTA
jgi:aminoglycoside phosphotransferase (APT) family kinase protein